MPAKKKTATKRARKVATQPAEDSGGLKVMIADSLKQAAELTGHDLAVLKRAKAGGCNAFRNTRVYIDELQDWLAENPQTLGGTAAERLDFQAKQVKLNREKLEYRKARGELIQRAEVQDAYAKSENATRELVRQIFVFDAATRVANQDAATVRDLLEESFDRLCEEQRRASEKWIRR